MTKTRKFLVAVVALGGVMLCWWVFRSAAYVPAAAVPVTPSTLGFPWRGVIHAHSTASDGAGDIDEIVAAAAEAGIDFLVLTDHNVSAANRPETAWYGDVLLIGAEEISTEEGHLLALQVEPHRYRFGPSARQALADIHAEGGWALVAHADHEWQAMAAAWSRQSGFARALTIGSSFVDTNRAALRLLGYRWPMLEAWDALTTVTVDAETVPRRRVAIAAADAHGPFVGPVPSYADEFAALSTLVWIEGSPEQARRGADADQTGRRLMEALRAGHVAVETTAIGDARSFRFVAESAGGTAAMGDFADWEAGPWRLLVHFEAAAEAEIVLLRDGVRVARQTGVVLEVDADQPGTYRVEIYRPDVANADAGGAPWLISNPIYVWQSAARSATRMRRVPPLPAPPLTRDLLAEAVFTSDERGVVGSSVVDNGFPTWEFALEEHEDPEAFAAMAWRAAAPMDWSDADGVVVDLRARERLRINLEVRAFNAEGDSETWAYSLEAGPQTRAIAVPWSRFRSPWSDDLSDEQNADPSRPTAADLRRVHGAFFVVTPTLLEPGSRATLELHKLGLY